MCMPDLNKKDVFVVVSTTKDFLCLLFNTMSHFS
jgi:hypothetical protein